MSGFIDVEDLQIGRNTKIESSAIIRGLNGTARKVVIGDNCYIGANVQIICDEFSVGDYSKIHHNTNIHGYLPCHIGHNAWIGQFCIIDSIGGTEIGNNCGIGAHSQLWSHIKFGDTLEGCRFNSKRNMKIGDDVWFVGHCIVTPITAEDKSMAMVGSVVTKDMHYNEIYAGSPAVSISDKVGFQFNPVDIETKYNNLINYLKSSGIDENKIQIVRSEDEIDFGNNNISYFNIESRKYTKNHLAEEIGFMRFLLPDKAKFIPY